MSQAFTKFGQVFTTYFCAYMEVHHNFQELKNKCKTKNNNKPCLTKWGELHKSDDAIGTEK